MRSELEKNDIEAIALRVVEMIKPLLKTSGPGDDTIFDKKGLAAYLGVPETWVDKSMNQLPYFKIGKYPRFRKSAIDRYIESQTLRPTDPLKRRAADFKSVGP